MSARLSRLAREATEPAPGAVERLRARARGPRILLQRSMTEPEPGALTRLAARLERPRRSRGWLLIPALAVASALAWSLWPPAPPPRLDGRLDAEERVARALTADIEIDYQGHGEFNGTTRDLRIQWEVGTLDLDLRPDAGLRVVVATSEGEARVTGTRFSVTRGPLGTQIEVQRGSVQVTCLGDAPSTLSQDERALCLPTRPAGMLGRARALREGSADDASVLEAVARGLSLAHPGDPAIGELWALRLDILISNGRWDEARTAARAYLDTGDPTRREEVEQILGALERRR